MKPRSTAAALAAASVLLAAAFVTPGNARAASPAERRFAEAHAQAEAGQRAAAREGFEASIDALPLLADHSLWFAAKLAARDEDANTARRHLDRLLAQAGDSVWREDALVLRGNLALESGDATAALKDFDAAIRGWAESARTPARLGRARALAASGQPDAAFALSLELASVRGAEGKAARELREKLASSGAASLGLREEDFRLRLARARLATGDIEEAAGLLPPLLTAGNDPATRAQAEMLAAAAASRAGRKERAAALVDGLIQRGAPPNLAGDALYGRARAAWNRNEDAAARLDYEKLLRDFRDHARAADARHALARIAEADGRAADATRRYAEIGKLHPQSRVAETAAWRRGFVLYLEGDYGGAAEAWHALGDDPEGLYWRARALDAMGRGKIAGALRERLQQRHPMSYYNWWISPGSAAKEPGLSPSPAGPRATSLPGGEAEPVDPVQRRHLARARLLHRLELPESAERELDAIRQETGSTPFLLDEYARIGAWGRSIRIARTLEARGTTGLETRIHPLAHAEHFRRAGERHGVDPLLLASLSRRESLFEERARSPVGAFGLMQLMPKTARVTAGRQISEEELGDASTNIEIGTRYLRQLLDEYDGRLVPALAAYNGGPVAVARWEKTNGNRPGDEFVELITYRETRRYVKAVLENYRIYRRLYGNSDAATRLY